MLANRAPKERQINTFKQPFDSTHTPYKLKDFHLLVKEFCKKAKKQPRLRIAKTIFIGDIGVGKTSLINRAHEAGTSSFCAITQTKKCHEFVRGTCGLLPMTFFLQYSLLCVKSKSLENQILISDHRFRENTFLENSRCTIGVDCFLEGFDILGVPFNIQIWDTAGQERFRCIATPYFRGTTVIVLVFDLKDGQSLINCERWLDTALEATNLKQTPYIVLVGNKLDDVSFDNYLCIKEAAVSLAGKLGAEYWIVSSKTGENVDKLFRRIAVLAFEWMVLKDIPSLHNLEVITLSENGVPKMKTCAC